MLRHLLLLLALSWSVPLAAAPRVVASIMPVHSLVAGVMDGVGEPQLLIGATASPHDYSMKPSDARALSEAALVVWVGEGLESMLAQPLRSLPEGAQVLTLSRVKGIERLPSRAGGVWEKGGHHHEQGEGHGHGGMDTHLWLSPANARQIVSVVAAKLGELDAENRARYQANAERMVQRIAALEAELKTQLAPLHDIPYIVFHDAYHYFEDAFGLQPVGAIAVSPDRRPGARRLIEIRRAITESGARCVFSEPQFRPAIVEVVLEGSDARSGVLDPLGASLPPGKAQWFSLMQGLAESLRSCLAEEL